MAAPRPPSDADLLAEADRAERAGEMAAAAAALRTYVDRNPTHARVRLRFGRALMATGDRPAARVRARASVRSA